VNLAKIVRTQLFALAQWAQLPDNVFQRLEGVFSLLTHEALMRPVQQPFKGLSKINPDGLPFQWSFCIDNKPPTVRFLCESGTPGTSLNTRIALSLNKLKETCSLLDIPSPAWFRDIVMSHVMPDNQPLPDDWLSAIWFAVGAGKKGVLLKIYVNLMKDAPIERWKRIGRVLRDIGRKGSLVRLCELSGHVSKDSWPSGLAIDIMPDGTPGRIKVYFRSGEVYTGWIENWYKVLNASEHLPYIRKMLEILPWQPNDPYPQGTFFVSMEFSSDNQISLKTDFTVTRWGHTDQHIVSGVKRLIEHLKLNESFYTSGLAAIGAWPNNQADSTIQQLVGLGFEPDGSRHLNVYCEPPLSSRTINGYKHVRS